MKISESAIVFPCVGETLMGILACPELPGNTGMLIVVGGPQYRAGSHRQFLLLSRAVAAAGYPAMRFDYRGMGDSTGELRNFEAVDVDIAAAIDVFMASCPGLERIVIWGLCDAASAALLYWDTTHDQRIAGLTLLNPWVRSDASLALTHIKHYYARRILNLGFWRKLLGGQVGFGRAIGDFLNSLRNARQTGVNKCSQVQLSFQERMLRSVGEFRGAIQIILSGDDYTAKEFIESTKASSAWQEALRGINIVIREVIDADHTFSSSEWRTAVEKLTIDWLRSETGVRAPDNQCTSGGMLGKRPRAAC